MQRIQWPKIKRVLRQATIMVNLAVWNHWMVQPRMHVYQFDYTALICKYKLIILQTILLHFQWMVPWNVWKNTVFGWEILSTGNIPWTTGLVDEKGWQIQVSFWNGYRYCLQLDTGLGRCKPPKFPKLHHWYLWQCLWWIESRHRENYWRSINDYWSRYYWHFIGNGCQWWREFRRNV